MEKTLDVTSTGLMVWQIVSFILLIVVVYLLVKMYKLMARYFTLKIKELEKKADTN